MPSKPKLTAEEKAANYDKLATEATNKFRRVMVETAMRNHPSVIGPLWDKLKSLGFTEEKIKQKDESAPKSHQKEMLDSRKKRRLAAKEEHDSKIGDLTADDPSGATLPADPVAENVDALEDIPVARLRDKVVCSLSDNSSAGNLRKLKGEGGSKTGLLRMIEFGAGMRRHTKLRGTLRCYNRLSLHVKAEANLRGKRSLLLSLPPVWPEEGLLEIVGRGEVEGTVLVKNRGSGKVVVLQPTDVPVHEDLEDLYVDFNWSEERVALRTKSTKQGVKHVNLGVLQGGLSDVCR